MPAKNKREEWPLIPFNRMIDLAEDFARVETGRRVEYDLAAREKAVELAIRMRRNGHSANKTPVPPNYQGKILTGYFGKREYEQ